MAILVNNRIENAAKLGIWHITESVNELLQLKNFSEEDIAVLHSFAYEQRKKEWLAARILLEYLLNEKGAQIVYNKFNKPFILNSPLHISLSHSHNLLTMIIDEKETGIDIELIKPKIVQIKEKFMSKSEIDSLVQENIQEQITIYWCVKESLYKLYGKKKLDFKNNLFVEPFHYSEKGTIKGWIISNPIHKCFLLHYEKKNFDNKDYLLTYIINQD